MSPGWVRVDRVTDSQSFGVDRLPELLTSPVTTLLVECLTVLLGIGPVITETGTVLVIDLDMATSRLMDGVIG